MLKIEKYCNVAKKNKYDMWMVTFKINPTRILNIIIMSLSPLFVIQFLGVVYPITGGLKL